MEFKIKDLEYALARYTSVIGAIEDKSDRVNTNKRQAFINAFAEKSSIYDLRDLFNIKDTNNIRYAIKKHEDKYLTYLDYCDNYRTAEAVKHMMMSNKILKYETVLEKAETP
jgi:hypothetical protein|tara:strand:+ start:1892 stop:2227 length:336 start_codon:yes stop_codon:yes gene_type:complete